MKKVTKIGLTTLASATAGLFCAGNYLYNLALNRNSDKSAIFANPKTSNDKEAVENKNDFFTSVSYQEVFIKSDDNLKLHGYTFFKPGNDYVIVVHGYTSQGNLMGCNAQPFYDWGFSVLVPDLRGHGQSEGDYIGMGWLDRLDIIKWIEHIVTIDSEARIILYGVSMGAATVMNVTGEQLPSNVVLAIEDCGYTSIKDMFAYQLKKMYGLPPHPIIDVANLITKKRAGYSIYDGQVIEQVKKASIPILFIHGDKDKFVPFAMLEKLYNSANCPKDKLVISGLGHAQCAKYGGEIYWNKIKDFISKYKG